MRTRRTDVGPFKEKPYFSDGDFEQICQDELERFGLYPSSPTPVRIDRFVEKRFGVSPTYEDLPAGILGFTLFGAEGVQEIVVSKALDDSHSRPTERRLRTTLAHEAGHGLLHADLFALGARPRSLFGEGLAEDCPKILCRDGGVTGEGNSQGAVPPYRWWEYQANQAMAALLLPKRVLLVALGDFLTPPTGLIGFQTLPEPHREDAIRLLSDTFDVNPVVVRLRLSKLFPMESAKQLTL